MSDIWIIKSGSSDIDEIKELIKVSSVNDLKKTLSNFLTSYNGERIIDLSNLSKIGVVELKVERMSVWSPFVDAELSPSSDHIQLNYYTLVDINIAKYLKRQIKIHSIEFGYKTI